MVRQNLLYNPSFRSGIVGWTGRNQATIALDTTYHFYGDESIRVTKFGTNSSGIISAGDPVKGFPLVTPGLPYAASVYVLVPTTVPATDPAPLSVRISWLNALGVTLSTSSSDPVTVSPKDGWVRLQGVFTAPAGASRAQFSVVQPTAGTTGMTFYMDAALLEQSNYVGGYLDNITMAEESAIVNKALSVKEPQTIGTLQLNADVFLSDLVLNTIDEDNVLWVCTDIDGWWGHSAPEMPDITRGVDDGSYDVQGRYQARTLVLAGTFIPPSPEDMPAARDKLVAVTDLVRKGAWLRTNENPTKAAFVRLNGQPKITTVNPRGRTDFEIPLKSGDPIKYHWNDADLGGAGLTSVVVNGNVPAGIATNIGTSPVTAVFRVTGPMGTNSTIYNSATDETITLVNPLRRAAAVGSVTTAELYNNNAVLTTSLQTNIVVGDTIVVSGVGAPFDTASGYYTVNAVSNELPYTISFPLTGLNIDPHPVSGLIALSQDDVLEIDTYEKSVTFNGQGIGQRSRLDTLIDWIKLAPGNNAIALNDNIDAIAINHKKSANGTVTLTAEDITYFQVGETINVQLPTQATLLYKQMVNGVATLTTVTNHGFSVGDAITVTSSSTSVILAKTLTTNGSTSTAVLNVGPDPLNPQGTFDFQVNDKIDVTLPTTTSIIQKEVQSDAQGNVTVILTANAPHGFSSGDEVTVALPTNADIATKGAASGIVTLGTTAAHNFSLGDRILVTLPGTAQVTNKWIDGAQVILTTSANHNFSTGDVVTVALPTGSTDPTNAVVPVGTATFSGSPNYLVTITTSGPHGFAVGDQIQINIDHDTDPMISGYNGVKVIEAVTSTTFSYLYYGSNTGGANSSATSTVGPNATVTNLTNQALNGTRAVTVTDVKKLQYYYTATS